LESCESDVEIWEMNLQHGKVKLDDDDDDCLRLSFANLLTSSSLRFAAAAGSQELNPKESRVQPFAVASLLLFVYRHRVRVAPNPVFPTDSRRRRIDGKLKDITAIACLLAAWNVVDVCERAAATAEKSSARRALMDGEMVSVMGHPVAVYDKRFYFNNPFPSAGPRFCCVMTSNKRRER